MALPARAPRWLVVRLGGQGPCVSAPTLPSIDGENMLAESVMGWLTRARGCLQYKRISFVVGAAATVLAAAPLAACSSSKESAPATPVTATPDAGAVDAAPDVSPDDPACNAFEPRATVVDVVLGPTDLEKTVVAAIDAAKTSIDLSTVEIGTKPVLQSLAAAKKRGVTLRVVVPQAALADVKAALGDVVHAPRADLELHDKVMVVDGAKAFVGSGALGQADTDTARTFSAFVSEPGDVDQLSKLVAHDWSGTAASPTFACTKLVLSPVNARSRVTELVESAGEKLDLELMEATDDKLVASIKARVQAGVHPRVLLADPVVVKTNSASGDALTAAGAEVRYYRKLTLASSLVVTERAAMIGSHDLATVSLDTRRDVSVFVSNDAALTAASDAFEADWAAGTPR